MMLGVTLGRVLSSVMLGCFGLLERLPKKIARKRGSANQNRFQGETCTVKAYLTCQYMSVHVPRPAATSNQRRTACHPTPAASPPSAAASEATIVSCLGRLFGRWRTPSSRSTRVLWARAASESPIAVSDSVIRAAARGVVVALVSSASRAAVVRAVVVALTTSATGAARQALVWSFAQRVFFAGRLCTSR